MKPTSQDDHVTIVACSHVPTAATHLLIWQRGLAPRQCREVKDMQLVVVLKRAAFN